MAALNEIVKYMDGLLKPDAVNDASRAFNGLQIENQGKVVKIAAAVDGCEATINEALWKKADLLIVHHGLFWHPLAPVVGPRYKKLRAAITGGLAVYSSHLPLDIHPIIGNNILLAKALELRRPLPFLERDGVKLGVQSSSSMMRDSLVKKLSDVVKGPVHVCPGGPARVRKVGIITGGAGSMVEQVAAEGIDTFITGEAPHWAYPMAEELGVNLLLAGHYATETFGVKALSERVAKRFKMKWDFIDHPTGL